MLLSWSPTTVAVVQKVGCLQYYYISRQRDYTDWYIPIERGLPTQEAVPRSEAPLHHQHHSLSHWLQIYSAPGFRPTNSYLTAPARPPDPSTVLEPHLCSSSVISFYMSRYIRYIGTTCHMKPSNECRKKPALYKLHLNPLLYT